MTEPELIKHIRNDVLWVEHEVFNKASSEWDYIALLARTRSLNSAVQALERLKAGCQAPKEGE